MCTKFNQKFLLYIFLIQKYSHIQILIKDQDVTVVLFGKIKIGEKNKMSFSFGTINKF